MDASPTIDAPPPRHYGFVFPSPPPEKQAPTPRKLYCPTQLLKRHKRQLRPTTQIEEVMKTTLESQAAWLVKKEAGGGQMGGGEH